MMSEKKQVQVKFCKQLSAVIENILRSHDFGKGLVGIKPEDGDDLFNDSCAAIAMRNEIYDLMLWLDNTAKYSEICDAAGLYNDNLLEHK